MIQNLTAISLECRVREVFYTHFSEEQLRALLSADDVDITDEIPAMFATVLPNPFQESDTRSIAIQFAHLAADVPWLLTAKPSFRPKHEDIPTFSAPLRQMYENAFDLVTHYVDDELELLLRIRMILSPSARVLYGVLRADYVSRTREKLWFIMWPGRAREILKIEDAYGWEQQVRTVLMELIDAGLVQQDSCDDEAYILTPSERAGLLEKFEMLGCVSPDDPLHEEAELVTVALTRRRQQQKSAYEALLAHWTQTDGHIFFGAMKMATNHTGPSYIHIQAWEVPTRNSNGKIVHTFSSGSHYLFGYESAEKARQKEDGLVLSLEQFDEAQQCQIEQGLQGSDVQGFDAAFARFQEQAIESLAAWERKEPSHAQA